MHDSLPDGTKLGALLDADGQPNPLDKSNAILQDEVEALTNKLHEERFLWIIACVVLINCYVFSNMDNWAGPIVIGIVELIGTVIVADRCRVDTVAPLIDKLTGFANKVADRN